MGEPTATLTRRTFVKWGGMGAATAALSGSGLLSWVGRAEAAVLDVGLSITDGVVNMIDGTPVYHWSYSTDPARVEVPGRVIQAAQGDTVRLAVRNTLDEAHSFTIPGVVSTGAIPPGQIVRRTFTAPAPATYTYFDAVNSPVGKVLGLHGALVVMPLGADNVSYVGGPTFVRQYVWVLHAIDTRWNAAAQAGRAVDKTSFVPRFFTINGRSGDRSAQARDTSPRGKVGEPALVRMVNSGLPVKCIHFHGNHVRVLARNAEVLDIQPLKDAVFMPKDERVDVRIPFDAPPDAFPPVATSKYVVHDHQEMTQTADGGLYPNGMLTDWVLEP